MPFSQQKLDEIQKAIRLALVSTAISAGERNFLRDMQAKLNRFERNTRLSNKQYRRLMRLINSTNNKFRPVGTQGRMPQSRRFQRQRRPTIGNFLVIIILLGLAVYKATERFPEYLGPIVAITATQTINGQVTHVRDGDTIEVSGIPIRFGSLDCAEAKTAKGRQATARMRELVTGQRLTCHLNGRISYDRKIGSCRMGDGRDLAAILIREGYCGRYW